MRALTTLLVVGLLVSAPLSGQQKQKKKKAKAPQTTTSYEIPLTTSRGRSAVAIPVRTDNGVWYGTWIYVNRDYSFALWVSEDEGTPIAKLRMRGNGNLSESFETNWQGRADYDVQGYSAYFDFRLGEANQDVMKATWDWDLDFQGSSRREEGTIEMFRAGDGRQLVMHFTDFKRVIESASGDKEYSLPQVWTFRKLSKRLVLWEELPF